MNIQDIKNIITQQVFTFENKQCMLIIFKNNLDELYGLFVPNLKNFSNDFYMDLDNYTTLHYSMNWKQNIDANMAYYFPLNFEQKKVKKEDIEKMFSIQII